MRTTVSRETLKEKSYGNGLVRLGRDGRGSWLGRPLAVEELDRVTLLAAMASHDLAVFAASALTSPES